MNSSIFPLVPLNITAIESIARTDTKRSKRDLGLRRFIKFARRNDLSCAAAMAVFSDAHLLASTVVLPAPLTLLPQVEVLWLGERERKSKPLYILAVNACTCIPLFCSQQFLYVSAASGKVVISTVFV